MRRIFSRLTPRTRKVTSTVYSRHDLDRRRLVLLRSRQSAESRAPPRPRPRTFLVDKADHRSTRPRPQAKPRPQPHDRVNSELRLHPELRPQPEPRPQPKPRPHDSQPGRSPIQERSMRRPSTPRHDRGRTFFHTGSAGSDRGHLWHSQSGVYSGRGGVGQQATPSITSQTFSIASQVTAGTGSGSHMEFRLNSDSQNSSAAVLNGPTAFQTPDTGKLALSAACVNYCKTICFKATCSERNRKLHKTC